MECFLLLAYQKNNPNTHIMKSLLQRLCIIMIITLLVSSCSTYQYATVSSNLNNNANGEQIIENDTVKVSFTFSGQNCPVSIKVLNNCDQPIYVNWKNSSLIIDGNNYPLWTNEAELNLKTEGYSYYLNENYFETSSYGTINKKEAVSFMPPKTTIINNKYNLVGEHIQIPKSHNPHKIKLMSTNGLIEAKKYTFTSNDSPKSFRLYLTCSMDEQQKSTFVFDETFWISEIIATSINPENFKNNAVNNFYIRKITGFGKATTYIIGIPLIIGLAALSAE